MNRVTVQLSLKKETRKTLLYCSEMFLDLCNKSPPADARRSPCRAGSSWSRRGLRRGSWCSCTVFPSQTPVACEDLLCFTPLTPGFLLLLFCTAPPPPAHLQLQPAHNSPHPRLVPTPHQWPYLPNKPSAFKRRPLIQGVK